MAQKQFKAKLPLLHCSNELKAWIAEKPNQAEWRRKALTEKAVREGFLTNQSEPTHYDLMSAFDRKDSVSLHRWSETIDLSVGNSSQLECKRYHLRLIQVLLDLLKEQG